MGSRKSAENDNSKYLKKVITDIMGEESWNSFCDVVTKEKPRIDIYDDNSILTVLAEVPGIQSLSDIYVTLDGNKLNIKGVTKSKHDSDELGLKIKSECIFGNFDRTVVLPYPVDEKDIKAVYEYGILEITLKKQEVDESRNIRIDFRK